MIIALWTVIVILAGALGYAFYRILTVENIIEKSFNLIQRQLIENEDTSIERNRETRMKLHDYKKEVNGQFQMHLGNVDRLFVRKPIVPQEDTTITY